MDYSAPCLTQCWHQNGSRGMCADATLALQTKMPRRPPLTIQDSSRPWRLPARPAPPPHPTTTCGHPSPDAISQEYTHAQAKPHKACWCRLLRLPTSKEETSPSPHGTPIGTSVYLPTCCQKATPEDIAAITLPQGKVPEFPDLPLPDPYDMDIGESQIVLTYDPFAQGLDDADLLAG